MVKDQGKPKLYESHLERLLQQQLDLSEIDGYEREYRFILDHVGTGPGVRHRIKQAGFKDWRFDFAWPNLQFAVEIEGATPSGGRHQRIYGFLDDIEKYHVAIDMGWTVYRTSGPLIINGKALQLIEKMVCIRDW